MYLLGAVAKIISIFSKPRQGIICLQTGVEARHVEFSAKLS